MIRLAFLLMIMLLERAFNSEAEDIEVCSSINPPEDQDTCNSITRDFTIPGFKCCFITAEVEGVKGKACRRIEDKEIALEIVKQSIRNSSGNSINIECLSLYLFSFPVLLLLPLFL